LPFKEVVFGITDPDGNAAGKPVIGRGQFIMKHLSILDPATGKGRTGPYWTTGAQGVEVEYDVSEHTFRLVKAATVMDAGKVINPGLAKGQVLGGMNMGLSLATREINHYKANGEMADTSFRTYKVMHYAENPQYVAEFVETPNLSGPFSARGIAEHSVLGMPPALANALGLAANVQLDALPISFETLWQAVTKGDPYACV
jgi:CO/xanthine dehydrogenase Mo-binding subunit